MWGIFCAEKAIRTSEILAKYENLRINRAVYVSVQEVFSNHLVLDLYFVDEETQALEKNRVTHELANVETEPRAWGVHF